MKLLTNRTLLSREEAFSHISGNIDKIYKQLTKRSTHPLGGTAYLNLENEDDPFLNGIKYTAMPPSKRFRDMEQLSDDEKTLPASPFFILDEVDAALDNLNVAKVVAKSIVISLVDKAEALVGVSTGTLREAVQGLLHLTSQSIESHEGFRFMLGSQLVDGFGQVVYAWKAVWLSLLDRYPAFVGLSRHSFLQSKRAPTSPFKPGSDPTPLPPATCPNLSGHNLQRHISPVKTTWKGTFFHCKPLAFQFGNHVEEVTELLGLNSYQVG
ncbi:hypothetical protein SAY86_028447 [Trapa natans]|uniref:Uncharacterized protein n=1 Tax=Trapa natans TaxID=22666 RepID=A0AAN7LZC4_TRANT|nr:hypothetical protein SAY86_028447 [Trapa natans]